MEKESLNVLHDDELSSVLKKLRLLEKINEGEIKCKYCGEVITEERILALIPKNESVEFVCISKECEEKFLLQNRED